MKKIFRKVMSLSAAAVLMLMSSAAIFADEGEVEYTYITADSEAQLLLDKAALETTYIAKGKEDGKVYDVSWTEIEKIKTGEKVKDGEAVTVPFGPYNTESDAEAAMNEDKANDSESAYSEISYSEITRKAKPAGEGTESTFRPEVEYSTIEACQAAIDAKVAELKAAGYTAVTASEPKVSSSEINSIKCTGQSKLDSAERYEVDGCNYIIIKQGTWYVIWTEKDMSAFEDVICSYAETKDPSLDKATCLGMWHGFGTFSTNEKNSGEYTFEKGDNGSIILKVSDKKKISHMDYGTFDAETSDKYSFEIKYTVPAPTEYEYSFTKTVQKYKEKIIYKVGYSVKVSEMPNDPPEETTSTGTEAATDPSGNEGTTEITDETTASTAGTTETTEAATEKTEPTTEITSEESGTTVDESKPSDATTEEETTEVVEETESGSLANDPSSDDPSDPSKTNPLIYDPTASAGDDGNADKSAKTGDNVNLGAIAAVLVLSGLGAAGALLYRRKKA